MPKQLENKDTESRTPLDEWIDKKYWSQEKCGTNTPPPFAPSKPSIGNYSKHKFSNVPSLRELTKDYINRLHIGTGKTTWELVRLVLQSYSGLVCYIVMHKSIYIDTLLRPENIKEYMTELKIPEIAKLYKPEHVLVISLAEIEKMVARSSIDPYFQDYKDLDSLVNKFYTLLNFNGIKTSIVFSHEILEYANKA